MTSVREFYTGKTIFITGGSGFMGKVLVEKLLYSCSDLKQIILLMRPKKGLAEADRVKEFEKLQLFERIMNEKPEVMRKILVVKGELSEPNLGLSNEDMRHVIESTNIVFHVAASIKFSESLKRNLISNLLATRKVLELSKQMEKLCALVHVSTAFCNVECKEPQEIVYEAGIDPVRFMNYVLSTEDATISKLEHNMVGEHPNSYTFTKRLAEILVSDEYRRSKLPFCIVRPSIVGPSLNEPFPGWTDTLTPISCFILGCFKGVLKAVYADENVKLNIVPVDVAINGFVLAAKELGCARHRCDDIQVYNMTVSNELAPSCKVIFEVTRTAFKKYPLSGIIWRESMTYTNNIFYYWFLTILCQLLPAVIIDFSLILIGRKQIMMHSQRKLIAFFKDLRFFVTTSFNVNIENFEKLWGIQTEDDRLLFPINVRNFSIEKYLEIYYMATRVHNAKDPMSTVEKSKRRLKVFCFFDALIKFTFFFVLINYLFKFF